MDSCQLRSHVCENVVLPDGWCFFFLVRIGLNVAEEFLCFSAIERKILTGGMYQ